MRRFRPSATFISYYNAVIAAANGPITPGMGHLDMPIPAGLSDEERSFAETKLAALIAAINTYRDSVPAIGATSPYSGTIDQVAAMAASGDPAAQQVYEQMLWQQASSSAP